MNSLLIFAVILGLGIVLLIVDHYLHKRWLKGTLESIDRIFDGIKTFFFVTLVDRFSAAFDEKKEDDSESDDILGI